MSEADELYEMVNIYPADSGLPMTVRAGCVAFDLVIDFGSRVTTILNENNGGCKLLELRNNDIGSL